MPGQQFDVLIRQLQGSGPGFEVGDLKLSAAASAGSGWLLCDGSTYNTSDYPALAGALGAGGATFAVPDFRGRAPVGAGTGAGLTARALLAAGGTEPSNMPSHSHGGNTGNDAPDHSHTPNVGGNFLGTGGGASANITTGGGGYTQVSSTGGASTRHTHPITPQGGGADNMMPWRAVNVFIRT